MPRKNRDLESRKQDSRPAIDIRRVIDETIPKINMGALHARVIGLRMIDLLSPFTVMLAMTKTESPVATEVFTNGTGTMVDTGQRKLLVTKYHVYEEFKKWRSDVPCSRLVMSGVDGTLFANVSDQECIASDKTYDLAVLSISPSIVDKQGKKFYPAAAWPPQRPQKECASSRWVSRSRTARAGK